MRLLSRRFSLLALLISALGVAMPSPASETDADAGIVDGMKARAQPQACNVILGQHLADR